MSEETKELDVLDQVKKVEKHIKLQLLLKQIAEIKKMARQINELKEQTVILLEEVGLSDEDAKRVIDYVNEQPGVKLTERDKKALREKAVEQVEDEKEEIEVKINDLLKSGKMPFVGYSQTDGPWMKSNAMYANGTSLTVSNNVGYDTTSATLSLENADGTSGVKLRL